MADVYSAGTFITATMQTAGFAAQAEILDQLSAFINKFGVLLYIFAAASAFLAINFAGNYRIALYLLLGPIVFHFLIGSRGLVDGAVWKIGAGPERTLSGTAASTEEALAAVNASTSNEKLRNVTRANIPVAWPFRLFTSITDRLISTLTSFTLPLGDTNREEIKNVLFVSKTYALDSLLNIRIQNDVALEIFNRDLLSQCHSMMDAGLTLASPSMSERARQQLQQGMNNLPSRNAQEIQRYALETINLNRTEQMSRWNSGRELRITPSPATIRYMEATQNVTSPRSAARQWLENNAPGKRMEELGEVSMTCAEVWSVAADAITRSAKEQTNELLKEFGAQLSEGERGLFCVELARKIGMPLADSEEQMCRDYALVQIASVLMIRNAIQKVGYSKAIQDTKDRMNFVLNSGSRRAVPMDSFNDNLELADPYNTTPRVENHPQYGPRMMGRFKDKTTGKIEDHDRPYLMMNFETAGELSSGFVYNQQYVTRELRQGIFTLGLNFPYYQGILYFLLSVAYPFVALVAIFPGRSGALLNYFLAWLWVRSWDFTFSLVLVLDKIVWNLFPSVDFPQTYFAGRQLGELSVPSVFQKAFEIDPSYNTHAYYFILNTALLGVPTIAGLFTLRLRRNVIEGMASPFISSLSGIVKERSDIAGSQYGMIQMGHQVQYMKELYGAAMLSAGHQGEGVTGGMKAVSAQYWGEQMGAAKAFEHVYLNPTNQLQGSQRAQAEDLGRIASQATFNTVLEKEGIAQAYHNRLFHPVLGQLGVHATQANMMAAAFDGTGTYELFRIDEPLKEYVNALRDLVVTKELLLGDLQSTEILQNRNIGPQIRLIENTPGRVARQNFSREHSESATEALLHWIEQIQTGRNPLREVYDAAADDKDAREKAKKEYEQYIESLSKSYSADKVERILSLPTDQSQWDFALTDPIAPQRPIPQTRWKESQ